MNTPKLSRVIRLDSMPMDQTYYTPEGYLRDKPILTRIGIFEYSNPDGSVRRELRLPEDVFEPKSLASYKGKPVIITHDAGLIDKDNVAGEYIGTILSDGYRDGDNVRAEIVIHDIPAMKESHYKELSLGYSLDLEETPGEWNGQHYDAIQRNILINHLALVEEARAGDKARLNIDGRSKNKSQGGKVMSKSTKKARRSDGYLPADDAEKLNEKLEAQKDEAQDSEDEKLLSPEELEKVIAKMIAEKTNTQQDAEDEEVIVEGEEVVEPEEDDASKEMDGEEEEEETEVVVDEDDPEEKIPEDGEPEFSEDDDLEEPEKEEVIVEEVEKREDDEDYQKLIDMIDTQKAEIDFLKKQIEEIKAANADCGDKFAKDEDCEEEKLDADDEEEVFVEEAEKTDGEEEDADEHDAETENKAKSKISYDSLERMVNERVDIALVAKAINLDGVERLSPIDAKKKIIKAADPTFNFDGKSRAYVNAMYDLVSKQIKTRGAQDTRYQKRQMFNKDSRRADNGPAAEESRNRMIERHNKNKEDK